MDFSMVMDLDGAIHSVWIWGIWIRGFGYGGLGYGASDGIILTTATITHGGQDIRNSTMQVEEVQCTMITRIGILVLETTTITTKLIEALR
jgi:hypothetical protein